METAHRRRELRDLGMLDTAQRQVIGLPASSSLRTARWPSDRQSSVTAERTGQTCYCSKSESADGFRSWIVEVVGSMAMYVSQAGEDSKVLWRQLRLASGGATIATHR